MRRVLAVVPESPVAGFAAGDNQRPHRLLFNKLHDVLMRRWAKVRAQRAHHGQRAVGCLFQIGIQRKSDKPPGVIMKGAVVVAFMEFVQAQSKAKPQDPSFQIGLPVVINQIVGPTEGERAERK